MLLTPFEKLCPCLLTTNKTEKEEYCGVQIHLNKTKPLSLFSTLNNTNYYKDELNGNHGTMEINHTSHIRTPSSGYGKLRELICAYTLYNHVQTSADIINH